MKGDGNSQTCWEINPNCQAKKLDGKDLGNSLSCLAYEQKKGCWEIDWASYLKDKPEPQKGLWKGFYNIGCRDCPVYESHREEIENMINNINML